MSRDLGMSGHHSASAGSVEWYTPPEVFDALGLEFDLDPCAPPGGVPWIPARRSYSVNVDGMVQPWQGRVWLNPPYGAETERWVRRLAAHGNGIALVFARTDTRWFHATAPSAAALCFVEGRLTFVPAVGGQLDETRTNGNAGAPSMLMAFGDECAAAVARARMGLVLRPGGLALTGQASMWEAI